MIQKLFSYKNKHYIFVVLVPNFHLSAWSSSFFLAFFSSCWWRTFLRNTLYINGGHQWSFFHWSSMVSFFIGHRLFLWKKLERDERRRGGWASCKKWAVGSGDWKFAGPFLYINAITACLLLHDLTVHTCHTRHRSLYNYSIVKMCSIVMYSIVKMCFIVSIKPIPTSEEWGVRT